MLKVADVMTTNLVTISGRATIAQAIALMQIEELRSLIVPRFHVKDEYGILTERDIVYYVIAPGIDPEKITVADIMRKPCVSIRPNWTIQEAAQYFTENDLQRAPVIEQGKLLGILSLTDLIKLTPTITDSQDNFIRRIRKALKLLEFSGNNVQK